MSTSDLLTPDALRVDLQVLERRGITSLDLEVNLSVEWLQAALAKTDAEIRHGGRTRVSLHVQADGTVLARGAADLTFAVPCARCLAPAHVEATEDLCVTYVPDGHERARRVPAAEADADDGSDPFEEDDLDLYIYRGFIVDLALMVAEHVALAYPMRVLCGREEACRGLCSGCGANLNELDGAANSCAGCGRPLHEVSHSAVDRGRGPESKDDSPWRAALRKLRDN